MDLLGDTGVDGRLKSNSFLRKEGRVHGLDSCGSGQGSVADYYGHSRKSACLVRQYGGGGQS